MFDPSSGNNKEQLVFWLKTYHSRLNCPDKDDYKKLTRLIQYLRHTLYICLVLGKDSLDSVRWWIDASFAIHPDMRGHTGATMFMGKGSVFCGSWKQKLVTWSSTESEVVGVYDVLPQILWTKKFLEDQGVGIKETILYHDNMSSMLLEWNGQQSSTKRTKHMDIRYFYVGDHIQNKTLSLHLCPTDEMLADYFTKPLQGSLFTRLRNHIMGAEFEDGDPGTQRSVLEYEGDCENKMATEREQHASERDQNNENVCEVNITARDQNNENVCEMNATARDQNNENVRDTSKARDQNNEDAYRTKTHSGGKNRKQMTYREALIGLDNSEPSSDF